MSRPAGGDGGTTTPAMIEPEKRVVDSRFALWLNPAVDLEGTRPIVPAAGDLGAKGKFCGG